ncbi:MAG: hypothetical protein NUV88_02495 [Candidatus Kaiserbacteria bacterium]|nr:hypothetical protein [Candidatus Kaiserbacteria bacterium]
MEANIAYVHRFISSLVFTGVIETIILFLLVWFLFKSRELGWKRIAAVGLFASFSTIPYVWFVFPYLMNWARNTSLFWSELFAFVIEAILYRLFLKLDWKRAFLASLVCNSASYFLGPILRTYGLWFYW